MTAIDERFLPRFSYVHKPAGSPASLLFPGVPPTGALPASLDFPLVPQRESHPFRVLVVGDTQVYDIAQVDWLARDVVADLARHDAAFGVSLGDLVGDDLTLFDPLTQVMSTVGIPWYNVIGNHDINYDAASDADSDETFERVFGPPNYAFVYADVHFVVLDDVVYFPRESADGAAPRYETGFTDRQLRFLERYLARVPKDERVVLLIHIPLVDGHGRCREPCRAILERLASHPHTLSISGHTHIQGHHFLGPEDGNPGPVHHHWNSPTASGSWWRGAPDASGIPHTTMRDGSPNGISLLTFDGTDYAIRFRAARAPRDHQLAIHAPDALAREARAPAVYANVFAGSERSVVEMRVVAAGAGAATDWRAMEPAAEPDPGYVAMREREGFDDEGQPRFGMPEPVASPHLWRAPLPAGLEPGAWWIEVRSTDMFGQQDVARRILRIE